MAANKVIRSIEAAGGQRCVDIFRRPDGSWGFEEYRRECEDGRGWFVTGFFSERRYGEMSAAQTDARRLVVWLSEA